MPFEIPTPTAIEPGTYKAQLEKVETDEGNFGKYRKWFWIVEVDGKLESLSVLTSAHTGPNSKSYAWLTALLGRAPQAGETIEDPTGKTVLLAISKNDKGFNKVDAVMPIVEPTEVSPGIPR